VADGLVDDCGACVAAAATACSGSASKSINDVSLLSSVGLSLADAKLLKDAVL